MELPCIRCGACADACPAGLQPQQLLWDLRAADLDAAQAHGLLSCEQCGACDTVCPSRIALHARFIAGGNALAERVLLMSQADAARLRFEKRNARLLRESDERAERELKLAERSASSDAVAAAIERVRARRQRPPDPS